MKSALFLLLALPVAGSASAQQVITPPPPEPELGLTGPLDFCGEEFSVRLEPGERVQWRSSPYLAREHYTVESGDFSALVYRQQEGGIVPPSEGAAEVTGLPLSPVARRLTLDMPEGTATGSDRKEVRIVTFGIRYILHGRAETAKPLYLLGFHEDQGARFPFLDRIDPRPLAERNCTPSRTDPALAGRIVQIPR